MHVDELWRFGKTTLLIEAYHIIFLVISQCLILSADFRSTFTFSSYHNRLYELKTRGRVSPFVTLLLYREGGAVTTRTGGMRLQRLKTRKFHAQLITGLNGVPNFHVS